MSVRLYEAGDAQSASATPPSRLYPPHRMGRILQMPHLGPSLNQGLTRDNKINHRMISKWRARSSTYISSTNNFVLKAWTIPKNSKCWPFTILGYTITTVVRRPKSSVQLMRPEHPPLLRQASNHHRIRAPAAFITITIDTTDTGTNP